uniref:sensor histidine kinase n=1 Tax=uncultured Draconibacterium sp. TaxID=1573823 RepID=UPI00321628BA
MKQKLSSGSHFPNGFSTQIGLKLKLPRFFSSILFQSIAFGAFITAAILLVWDVPIARFNFEVLPFNHKNGNSVFWFFNDNNNDGNSEMFRCYKMPSTGSFNMVMYNSTGGLVKHWHINKSEWFPELVPSVFDIDEDELDELLFFTVRNDSIFLNALNLVNYNLVIDHLFFKCFERKRDNYACYSKFYFHDDYDNNGEKELFFIFDAGYGLYPRGIFKFDSKTRSFQASPTEYMCLSCFSFADLNSDGTPEILTGCAAPYNSQTCKNFTDTISYITVLDYNLNFLFPPIPMEDPYSSVGCIPDPKVDSIFYVQHFNRSGNKNTLSLMVLNNKGEILKQIDWGLLNFQETRDAALQMLNKYPYIFFDGVGSFVLTPDLKNIPLKLKANINDKSISPVKLDLDKDGMDEWIYADRRNNITIYNEKTDEKVTFQSPLLINSPIVCYPVLKNNQIDRYALTTTNGYFFFSYTQNRFYFLRYLIKTFIFMFFSGIIYTLFYFQQKSIEKKWQTEKQLSELQFNAVKNQLNPHFLFNALNSVAYMINEGKNDEAYDFLSINARMIQRVMNDAKEVKRSLKDEIQFTKDYIGIQKHRFKERFGVIFDIHSDVDMQLKVPKMCIHTYVENAIKHGFRNTKSGGLLKVDISPISNGVVIQVSDNGMGRKAASEFKDSSGNGITIMNEFYRLFEKYHGYKISIKISDIQPHGTEVKLHVLAKAQAQKDSIFTLPKR